MGGAAPEPVRGGRRGRQPVARAAPVLRARRARLLLRRRQPPAGRARAARARPQAPRRRRPGGRGDRACAALRVPDAGVRGRGAPAVPRVAHQVPRGEPVVRAPERARQRGHRAGRVARRPRGGAPAAPRRRPRRLARRAVADAAGVADQAARRARAALRPPHRRGRRGHTAGALLGVASGVRLLAAPHPVRQVHQPAARRQPRGVPGLRAAWVRLPAGRWGGPRRVSPVPAGPRQRRRADRDPKEGARPQPGAGGGLGARRRR